MSQWSLYLTLNACFAVLVAGGALSGPANGIHPLYLIPLFALCSSSFIGMRRVNDRYALLLLFSAVYFMSFGLIDCLDLLFGAAAADVRSNDVLTATELVILVGGALTHLGYRLACRRDGQLARTPTKDWPERTLLLVGGAMWIVCTALSWELKVNVIVDATIAAATSGLAKLSSLQAAGFFLAVMVQPLGILMLAYAQCRYRRSYLTPVLIVVVLVQLFYGFVIDVKGDALIGAVLVILTKLLVDSKLPKGWLVATVAFTAVAFPVMQANRVVRGEYGIDRTAALSNLGEVLQRSITTSKQGEHGRIFFGRASMKPYVDMIVTKAGKDVPYQYGYTLSPMLTWVIPRFIWADKPDVQTGQVVNKVFQISEQEDTYISPSHLGELYWNFGWYGVCVGMFSIGLLLGFIGARFGLEDSVTLTRIMIMVVTIRVLILAFESTIAAQYVVWMRSMLAIGLLHLLFARVPMREVRAPDERGQDQDESDASALPLRPFPNLMR
jgi:hypothetical protein